VSQIRCPLQEAAQISRHRPAILSPEGLLRFGHLEQCVEATTGILATVGVERGERIVTALRSSWRLPIVLLSAWRRGAMVCPVDYSLSDRDLMRCIDLARATMIITEKDWVPRFNRLVNLPAADVERITGVVNPGKAAHRPVRLRLDEPATMFFVSEEGRFRGIVHTVEGHYYSAVGSNLNIRLHSNDRWLLNVPPHVVSWVGIMFRCLLGGACMVIPDPTMELAAALREFGITHVSVTPHEFSRLLAAGADGRSLPHLQHLIVRGIPEESELREAESRGFRVHPCYGSVEMASQIAVSSDVDGPQQRATSGKILPYRQVKIDAEGHIHVRGRTLFSASVREGAPADSTTAEFAPGGWFNTGDQGSVDKDGYLRIRKLQRPEQDW